jgi:uncharacterized protein YecE (DUF72 family)
LIRIGISGWTYPRWRGVFYPKGFPHSRELEFASRRFRSIEINGTFYRLQRPHNFAQWRDETPEDFVFAVKGSRYVTHMLKLSNVETALASFFASGIFRLGRKLGPILWQFSPRLKFDPERFESFLGMLPRDTTEALKLARKHDARVAGRAWLKVEFAQALRHAFEIRHESFCVPEFIALLSRRGAALVCADTVDWPLLMDVTADFVYCRLHGSEELYASGYEDRALDGWARRVRAWARGGEPKDADRVAPTASPAPNGRDVFVYFDNDVKVRAPADAAALAARLELGQAKQSR